MRYGVSVPPIGDVETLVGLGVEADRAGWDGFFLWDHIRLFDEPVPVFDPWVVLAAIAVRTERVGLGTLVTPVARRRPWKLARETVTLDRLSGGRTILGVGLGYPPDLEFTRLGEDPGDRVRAEKLDEGLEVLTRLWSGDRVSFEGRHFRIDDTRFLPTPVQYPRIPVWVAGVWPSRAPFRRAARWDGVVPIRAGEGDEEFGELTPDELAEIMTVIRQHRTGTGRFDVVVGGIGLDPVEMRAFEAVGATWYLPDAGVRGPGWEDAMLALLRDGPPRRSSDQPRG